VSIKYKIILILLVVISLSSGIHFWIEQITIMPSFIALQQAEAFEDMDRCINALGNQVVPLSTMARDWSAWDDTCAFVVDRNVAYRESTLPPGSFISGNFNLLYIFDKEDRLVWGESRDSQTGESIDIPEFGWSAFIEQYGLLQHDSVDSSVDGILLTERGPLLTSSKPITTSEDTGPIRGTFVMDMQMPHMNGYEATRQIRATESGDFGFGIADCGMKSEIEYPKSGIKRVPIVALTADAMKGDDQKCMAAGCDDYLTKPIDCRELTRVIAKYLGTKQGVSRWDGITMLDSPNYQ